MNRKLNFLATLVLLNMLLTLALIVLDEMKYRRRLERLQCHTQPAGSPVREARLSRVDQLRRIYGQKLYSQYDEETLIRYFFKDRREGFFVEVGAGDYQHDSTTLYLERHLDWKGIATDANKAHATGYAQSRPHTRFFRCQVTDSSDPEADPVLPLSVPNPAAGDRNNLLRFGRSPQVASKWREIRVPMITLNKLLDDAQVKTIDFLAMDMEWGGPAALAGFDIQRFEPRLVCLEVAHASQADPAAKGLLGDYFRRNGYQRVEEFVPLDPAHWYFAPVDRGRKVRRGQANRAAPGP